MGRKLHWFLIGLVIIVSCTSQQSKPKDILRITAPSGATYLGIFFTGADSVRMESAKELIKIKLPEFIEISQFPDSINQDSYLLERYPELTGALAVPDYEYIRLAAQGLSEEEIVMLSDASSALMLTFFTTSTNILEKQRNIVAIMEALMEGKNNFIGDFNTRRYYSAASWKAQRVDPFVGKFMLQEITIHTYREEENYCRMVTLGMSKFCLPDISINNIVCGDQNSFGTLVNAIIATWSDRPFIQADSTLLIDLQNISDSKLKEYLTADLKEGAEQQVEVQLTSVFPEEGDEPNLQLSVVFKDPNFSSEQEQQLAMLKKLFGTQDKYIQVAHDEAILEASERAKARLPELQKLFKKGLEPGFSLLLKAPFTTDTGGTEWMWIEVTAWNNTDITGVLQNEPYEVSSLEAGAIVTVNQEDIFDYILSKPDGTYDGNETGKLMEKN
jgi:uncharacterized protein YegJ (DUF2314 family)